MTDDKDLRIEASIKTKKKRKQKQKNNQKVT